MLVCDAGFLMYLLQGMDAGCKGVAQRLGIGINLPDVCLLSSSWTNGHVAWQSRSDFISTYGIQQARLLPYPPDGLCPTWQEGSLACQAVVHIREQCAESSDNCCIVCAGVHSKAGSSSG